MFTLIVSICVLFPSKSQGQIRGHHHSERAVLFKQRRFGGAPSRIWHFLQGCLQTDCQRCGQGRKWFWIHGLMILWLVLLLISLSPLFLSRVFMCSCSPASLLSLCVVTFTVRLRLTVSSKSYNYTVWAIFLFSLVCSGHLGCGDDLFHAWVRQPSTGNRAEDLRGVEKTLQRQLLRAALRRRRGVSMLARLYQSERELY